MHPFIFERTFIDDDYEGTVEEAFEALTRRQKELEESLAQIEDSFSGKAHGARGRDACCRRNDF